MYTSDGRDASFFCSPFLSISNNSFTRASRRFPFGIQAPSLPDGSTKRRGEPPSAGTTHRGIVASEPVKLLTSKLGSLGRNIAEPDIGKRDWHRNRVATGCRDLGDDVSPVYILLNIQARSIRLDAGDGLSMERFGKAVVRELSVATNSRRWKGGTQGVTKSTKSPLTAKADRCTFR